MTVDRRAFTLLGLASLSACAPVIQRQNLIPAGFAGPRLERGALIAADGTRLPLSVWPALDAEGRPAEPTAVILALHGMDDYANANVISGPYWAARGITTYAYDQRGFGRGAHRGIWPGRAALDQDVRTACALLRARHPRAILAVAGESMGGAVAITAFASADPPDADRVVLLSPAVWGWGAQPPLNSLVLWLAAHTAPGALLNPPAWVFRTHQATDNIAVLRQMGQDKNLIFSTRVDAAYGLMNLMQNAREEIGAIKAPTLYAYGAHDHLIPKAAAAFAAAHLGANGRTAYYPNGWHLLNRDLHSDVVLADVVSFIRDPDSALPSGAAPIPRTFKRTGAGL
jgi:alpha-beta hydrolase superfamily lysophospholipase